MRLNVKSAWRRVKEYFNLSADREDEAQVVEQVSAGVVFRGTNLWILIFAILIASLGLNVNSTAVIIGAMLISPLMGPIIGLGLSVGVGDYDLLRRALKNYGVATLISVLTATVYFLISPLSGAQSELLARTSPSLYDVLIAFCGGAAGVLALTTKSKGQVIPGVAIATALMPPLCTAGYGLATAQWNYFFGAFYLFFINTVFISLSTFLGVKLLRFKPRAVPMPGVAQRGRRLMVAAVVVTMIPAVFMTVKIIQREVREHNVQQFVQNELERSDTHILSREMKHDTVQVVAMGRPLNESEIEEARRRMPFYRLKGYGLTVIQAADFESVENLTASLTGAVTTAQSRVAQLEQQLAAYTRYDTLSASVRDEARTLFPWVKTLAVGRIGNGTVAVVDIQPQATLPDGDREKLEAWLRTRVRDKQLRVIVIGT